MSLPVLFLATYGSDIGEARTLSDGTKGILGDLDTDVEIRFYATRDDRLMPAQLKNYIRHVEDLLNEYAQCTNGHLKITKFNPEPDSDAADSAAMDGVTGKMVSIGESIYLGMAISMLDTTVAIPFLDPQRNLVGIRFDSRHYPGRGRG